MKNLALTIGLALAAFNMNAQTELTLNNDSWYDFDNMESNESLDNGFYDFSPYYESFEYSIIGNNEAYVVDEESTSIVYMPNETWSSSRINIDVEYYNGGGANSGVGTQSYIVMLDTFTYYVDGDVNNPYSEGVDFRFFKNNDENGNDNSDYDQPQGFGSDLDLTLNSRMDWFNLDLLVSVGNEIHKLTLPSSGITLDNELMFTLPNGVDVVDMVNDGQGGSLYVLGSDGNTYTTNVSLNVEDVNPLEEVSVYPNPSNGNFKISNLEYNTQIVITSLDGRKVFETVSSNNTENVSLDSSLPTGIYLVKINEHFSKQIIKR